MRYLPTPKHIEICLPGSKYFLLHYVMTCSPLINYTHHFSNQPLLPECLDGTLTKKNANALSCYLKNATVLHKCNQLSTSMNVHYVQKYNHCQTKISHSLQKDHLLMTRIFSFSRISFIESLQYPSFYEPSTNNSIFMTQVVVC